MVAVTMRRLGKALAGLDPESRALLDLNVRRGMDEKEIGTILGVDAEEVGQRREKILSGLESDLQLDTIAGRDELRATLPDLPARVWTGG